MSEHGKRIAVVATLDTKSEHAAFLASVIEGRGHEALIVDIGILGEPGLAAAVSRREVAAGGGARLDDLIARRDRGAALDAMMAGTVAVVCRLFAEGRLDGIIGIGGGSGTAVASAAMRALPVGVPKVMVSTVASTAKAAGYVGRRDIVMVNTITDIIGMNPILRGVLANAAGAVCGMVETAAAHPAGGGVRPATVAVTAFGATTPAAMRCHALLTEAGTETMIFHANGAGGRSLEELVEQQVIDAVLDLTTTEFADELCGGLLSAGAHRLEAAGKRGIPQVVLPGAIDMVNFGPPQTVPAQYARRLLARHNPQTTLMRTSPEENAVLGRQIGEKLGRAKSPPVLILPLGGFSDYDRAGGVFYSPEADRAFMDAAIAALAGRGKVVRLDAHINDPACADLAVAELLELLRSDAGAPAAAKGPSAPSS